MLIVVLCVLDGAFLVERVIGWLSSGSGGGGDTVVHMSSRVVGSSSW